MTGGQAYSREIEQDCFEWEGKPIQIAGCGPSQAKTKLVMQIRVLRNLTVAVAMFAVGLSQGFAQDGFTQEAGAAGPVVVELFTSQACSSCTKAVAYFSELAARDNIIAIGWHVDYWNERETARGRWRDPYSDPACTKRQRQYNKNIRSRSSVYTPQMVINGEAEAIGSAREDVSVLINQARADQPLAAISARRDGAELVFDIGATPSGGEAFLIALKRDVTTEIPHGENAGLSIRETNVATELTPLGAITSDGGRLTLHAPAAGDHCAVIVQEPGQGRIVAAAYCAP